MDKLTEQFAQELAGLFRGVVKPGEPMSKHTTFGIGGPADIYIEPADADDLAAAMSLIHKRQIPWYVLGDGANVLVSDKGIRGVVIGMGPSFSNFRFEDERLIVGAAARLDRIVTMTTNEGFAGLEYAAAIPGTIGGAIVMNAGTYLGQVGDVVENVCVVTDEGEKLTLNHDDLQFRYRWSLFQQDRHKIIVEAVMRLARGDREELVKVAEGIRQRRSTNLPCGRSAGCVFKNPPGEHSAGRLIDMANLKGSRLGDAVVADKHANFIVNEGGASASEVRALAEQVRETIKTQFGVDLEYEVRIVGDW